MLLSANTYYPGNAKVKLTQPYNLLAPNFRPKGTSPALGAADFGHAGLSDPFFTPVTYVGAFDKTTDWTAGWANFNPVAAVYTGACACAPGAANSLSVSADATIATQAEAVVIYPNPAHGSFKVGLNGFNSNVNVKVSNMNGVTVYNSQKNGFVKSANVDVNLQNAAAGLYTVVVSDGSKSITKKVSILINFSG